MHPANLLPRVEVGTDADSEPITSCVVVAAEATLSQAKPKKLPANQQTMLHLLQDAGKEGLTLLQWNTKAKEQGIGTKRHSTLYEAERALKEAKLVHSYADRWYA